MVFILSRPQCVNKKSPNSSKGNVDCRGRPLFRPVCWTFKCRSFTAHAIKVPSHYWACWRLAPLVIGNCHGANYRVKNVHSTLLYCVTDSKSFHGSDAIFLNWPKSLCRSLVTPRVLGRSRTWWSIDVMACCLFGVKPLLQPMMTYHQLNSYEETVKYGCKNTISAN